MNEGRSARTIPDVHTRSVHVITQNEVSAEKGVTRLGSSSLYNCHFLDQGCCQFHKVTLWKAFLITDSPKFKQLKLLVGCDQRSWVTLLLSLVESWPVFLGQPKKGIFKPMSPDERKFKTLQLQLHIYDNL